MHGTYKSEFTRAKFVSEIEKDQRNVKMMKENLTKITENGQFRSDLKSVFRKSKNTSPEFETVSPAVADLGGVPPPTDQYSLIS